MRGGRAHPGHPRDVRWSSLQWTRPLGEVPGVKLDDDLPFPIPRADEGASIGVAPALCASPACTARHLVVVLGQAPTDGDRALRSASLEYVDGAVVPRDEGDAALLRSEEGRALIATVATYRERIEHRFERLEHRRLDQGAETRTPPPWAPASRIAFATLYPWEGTPTLVHEGRLSYVLDSTCVDPACPCEDAHLRIVTPDGTSDIEVEGVIGRARPARANRAGRLWWARVHDNAKLLETLRDRREIARGHGPFVVGSYYEARRKTLVNATLSPAESTGGGAESTHSELVYETARALREAQLSLVDWIGASVAVRIDGSHVGELCFHEDAVSLTFGDDNETFLTLLTRSYAALDALRRRCAKDLTLIAGHLVPQLDTFPGGPAAQDDDAEHARPASEEETVKLLVAIRAVLDAVASDATEFTTRTTQVSLGDARFEATLTRDASDEEAMAADDPAEDSDVTKSGELGSDESDDHDAPDTLHVDFDALVDDALTRGATDDQIDSITAFVPMMVSAATRDRVGGSIPWRNSDTFSWFLREHVGRGPFTDRDLAEILFALRALATWLEHVGHDDGEVEKAIDAAERRLRRERSLDLVDHGEVRAFLGRIGTEAPALPAGKAAKPNRWSPAPGESIPDDKASCPCGSGRRFKKCCKVR